MRGGLRINEGVCVYLCLRECMYKCFGGKFFLADTMTKGGGVGENSQCVMLNLCCNI